MSEQIDIAVDLGGVPPPLPEILNLRHLVKEELVLEVAAGRVRTPHLNLY